MKKYLFLAFLLIQGCATQYKKLDPPKEGGGNHGILTSLRLPANFDYPNCEIWMSSKNGSEISFAATAFKRTPQLLPLPAGEYSFSNITCSDYFGMVTTTYPLNVESLQNISAKKQTLTLTVPIKIEIQSSNVQISFDSEYQRQYFIKAASFVNTSEGIYSAYDNSVIALAALPYGFNDGVQIRYARNSRLDLNSITKGLLDCKKKEMTARKLLVGSTQEVFPTVKGNFAKRTATNYSDELYQCMDTVVRNHQKGRREQITVSF